jgi:hypothetical protein
MRPEVRAAYDRFVEAHHGEIEIGPLCEALFNSGAAAGIRVSAAFSDMAGTVRHMLADQRRLQERTEQLLGLLEGIQAEREFESLEPSVAWRTEP